MTVRQLIQELLLNSSLDDEVIISFKTENSDYIFQKADMVVSYDNGQIGIVGERD